MKKKYKISISQAYLSKQDIIILQLYSHFYKFYGLTIKEKWGEVISPDLQMC